SLGTKAMWMVGKFLEHLVRKGIESGTDEGLKKLSELTGSKAKQVEAATEVADKFLSALKNELFEEAETYCDAKLVAKITQVGGLKSYLSDYNFGSMTRNFTSVDDSSKANKWGQLYDVYLMGNIEYLKLGKPPESIKDEFKLQMLKESNGWKVNTLMFPPYQ